MSQRRPSSPAADRAPATARQHGLRRAFGVQPPGAGPPSASSVDISLSSGSKLYRCAAPAFASLGIDVGAERSGRDQHGHLRRISRVAFVAVEAGVVARGAVSASARRAASCEPFAGSAASSPVSVTSALGVQTAVGRMRFSVSVPVLSVQITSVVPSVSTALSRLTSAPRRASARDGDREREGDDRQQTLGHVAGQQPHGEHDAVVQRQPGTEDRQRARTPPPSPSRPRRSAMPPGAPVARAGWALP